MMLGARLHSRHTTIRDQLVPPHNAGSVEQGHMHAWITPRRSRPPITIDIEKLQRADTRGLISCLAAPWPPFPFESAAADLRS